MHPITEKAQKLETLQLKMLLKQRLQALSDHVSEVVALETSLKHFTEDYFGAVGEYASQLAALRHNEKQAQAEAEAARRLRKEASSKKQAKHQARLKESYYKLAKKFHPDNHAPAQEGALAPEAMMQKVNVAYHSGDIGTLLQMEVEHLHHDEAMMQDPLFEIAEKITRCESLISTCLGEATALRKDPMFSLYERHEQARMEGEDFISQVVEHMKDQIAEERLQQEWVVSSYWQPRKSAQPVLAQAALPNAA